MRFPIIGILSLAILPIIGRSQDAFDDLMTSAAEINTTGLTYWWRMNEGGGTNLTTSGTAITTAQIRAGAVFTNNPLPYSGYPNSFGVKLGSAGNQYILLPLSCRLPAPLAVSAWFKPDNVTNGNQVVYCSDIGPAIEIDWFSNQTTAWALITTNNTYVLYNPTNIVARNQWHHFLWAYDLTNFTAWVDGVKLLETNKTSGIKYNATANTCLIGAYGANSTPTVSGCATAVVDEVRFIQSPMPTARVVRLSRMLE